MDVNRRTEADSNRQIQTETDRNRQKQTDTDRDRRVQGSGKLAKLDGKNSSDFFP